MPEVTSRPDTIYALSSGALPSGVAVIRVSGSLAGRILEALAGRLPMPRQASLRWIRDTSGSPIDQALILHFPAPNSFTGEDCFECHVHGGRAVVARVLAVLADIDGLRHADAGEFAKRAFENGKLDLVEVEGLSDLLRAETEMQRRLAVHQSDGGVSAVYEAWSTRLLRARALIEAELDFADEADIPGAVSGQVWADMEDLRTEVRKSLDSAGISEIIRDGFTIVLAGPPNSGKSSLMNLLAKRDVSIVTDIAGTTRDVISVDMDLEGYRVRISDTAGLRSYSSDPVEIEGIRRSHATIRNADLVLFLQDVTSAGENDQVSDVPGDGEVLRILTKADLVDDEAVPENGLLVSVTTNFGIDSLLKRILEVIRLRVDHTGLALPARERHIDLLRNCEKELTYSLSDLALELRAEHLRRAHHHLGRITGSVDVEDLLGVIFSEFCVGK